MARIAVFGAGGRIGTRICAEAVRAGIDVIAVTRRPGAIDFPAGGAAFQMVLGDATDPKSVNRAVRNVDAIISAVGIKTNDLNDESLAQSARGLIAGARMAAVKRLLFVGGAGSLEVSPGIQAVDAPGFPAAYKPGALAQRRALEVFRSSSVDDLDWTYVSPAAEIAPGTRTGAYRIGYEQMLFDAQGVSSISMEDYAAAILVVMQDSRYFRKRITIAY